MNPITQRPRVFISHSHSDKPFVRRLVEDLRNADLNVWLDEQELVPGDSIIKGVSDGLKDTDYLVAILSRSSIQSKWVQLELNAALTGQLSGTGTAVLPVLIENIEIPVLLRDHLYADFRISYQDGLNMLLRAFRQEAPVPLSRLRVELGVEPTPMVTTNPCVLTLDALNMADLRRLIKKKFQRREIVVIWFDTFFSNMDDELPNQNIDDCIIELIDRAVKRGLTVNLLDALCHNRPDIANA